MTIVITLPNFFDGEAEQIVQLLHSSIDLVHIRKPQGSAEEIEKLIQEIPSEYYPRLVLHDHHELAVKYHLHGVHLNNRNPQPPQGWKGCVSRSCHSIDEVKEWKEKCDYVSLSPIFDSISKQGYHAAFSHEELAKAKEEGIIDKKVLALGGVTFNRIDEVLRIGFGGGMILGDAWKNIHVSSLENKISGTRNIHSNEKFCFTEKKQHSVALTIAGSDSSAGAGIQQDLKTMSSIGVYGATVITAVTSQNTLGVSAVLPMPAETVASQLEAVFADLNVVAIKIGMVPNAAIARTIALQITEYKKQHDCKVIYDPIMISTSGRRLMEESCIETVKEVLFPLCTLITPNIPEAESLLDRKIENAEEDGIALAEKLGVAVLVKGGHQEVLSQDNEEILCLDYLCYPNGYTEVFESRKIETHNLHGTGCTLSSAIAAYLVKGYEMTQAIQYAKQLVVSGIFKGKYCHIGKGNGPLILFDE